jgi:hypothetical protein
MVGRVASTFWCVSVSGGKTNRGMSGHQFWSVGVRSNQKDDTMSNALLSYQFDDEPVRVAMIDAPTHGSWPTIWLVFSVTAWPQIWCGTLMTMKGYAQCAYPWR